MLKPNYDVILKWHKVNVYSGGKHISSYDCTFDAREYHNLEITKKGTGQIIDGFSEISFYNKKGDIISTYSLPPRCIPAYTIEELKDLVQKKVDLVLETYNA